VGIYCKVKGFDEGRSEATSRRNPKGLPQIHPALRVSGWRTPFPGGIARSHDIGLATFRAVRLAIPETEFIPSGRPLL
jgi:hypothetical protein